LATNNEGYINIELAGFKTVTESMAVKRDRDYWVDLIEQTADDIIL